MENTRLKLSNLPPKGTADWFPEEYKLRKYIFDTWRHVCESFGYEEYLTPIFEKAEIYKAKSGEDLGGKELMVMEDKAGRELAIRPEMTPSVTRMVSRVYASYAKPLRLFSIANFVRNEKPQRGRNREFWQLNYDIFGATGINADIEVLQIALEIMLSFSSQIDTKERPFTLFLNDRRIILSILSDNLKIQKDNIAEVVRILDKSGKLSKEAFIERLKSLNLSQEQIEYLLTFTEKIESLESLEKEIKDKSILNDMKEIISKLETLGYKGYVQFKGNLIRGFDYYDGMIFEVFDNNKDNNRSLFGGGRYNGLAGIFGSNNIPAVGCAPGDETTKLFLESWGVKEKLEKQKEEIYYIPIIDKNYQEEVNKLANMLRKENKRVITGIELQNVSKALEFANKRDISKVILLGSNEIQSRQYIVKDMVTGEQNKFELRM